MLTEDASDSQRRFPSHHSTFHWKAYGRKTYTIGHLSANGFHTVLITVLGTHNASSSDNVVSNYQLAVP
jgi:hypothetical protein